MLTSVHSSTTGAAARWQCAPEWEAVLFDAHGLKLNEWIAEGTARVIKNGEHRTVYRVDLPEKSFYIKHYRCQRLRMALRHLVRATASRREWNKAQEVSRRAIPTITPVAIGEVSSGGFTRDNFFITEAVRQSQSLAEYLVTPAAQCERRRKEIIQSVAKLCAAAHRGGVLHDDFHLGNILVQPGEGQHDSPRLVLIDLPGVRLSGPLSWHRSRASLAMLGSGWIRKMPAAEQARFWITYLRARNDMKISDRQKAGRQLLDEIQSYTRRFLSQYDKRSTRSSSTHHSIHAKNGIGHSIASLPRAELQRLIDDPERIIREYAHSPVKLAYGSTVFEARMVIDGELTRIAYKRYRVRKWWKIPLTALRPSRALCGWKIGNALANRGIPTARPIAVVQPRALSFRRDSYLATQWIENTLDLHRYAWKIDLLSLQERTLRTRACARKLAELVGQLHCWGFRHRDLKATNVVARETAEGVEVLFVDMDGIRAPWRLSRSRREENLARLSTSFDAHPWITRTDRLRFLNVYLQTLGVEPRNWKRVFRSIAPHAARIRARLERRGLIA